MNACSHTRTANSTQCTHTADTATHSHTPQIAQDCESAHGTICAFIETLSVHIGTPAGPVCIANCIARQNQLEHLHCLVGRPLEALAQKFARCSRAPARHARQSGSVRRTLRSFRYFDHSRCACACGEYSAHCHTCGGGGSGGETTKPVVNTICHRYARSDRILAVSRACARDSRLGRYMFCMNSNCNARAHP